MDESSPPPPSESAPGQGSFFRRTRDERPVPAHGLEPGNVVGDFDLDAAMNR